MHLFHARGYDRVGIAELTDALGVAAPSLYAAYGSKAGLFARAVDAYLGEVDALFAPAFARRDAGELVATLLERAVGFYVAVPDRLGCLVLSGAADTVDAEAAAVAERGREAFRAHIAERLATLGAAEPEAAADACIVAMTGLSGAARTGLSREALEDAAARLARGIV